jgi:hypothetical protein
MVMSYSANMGDLVRVVRVVTGNVEIVPVC